MRVKIYKGKVFGAELTSAEQKAMNIEINRQTLIKDKLYAADIDALMLYALMKHKGWKKKRLKAFWKAFNSEHKALREHYKMNEPGDNEYLAHRELKKIGVDINEWYKEDNAE